MFRLPVRDKRTYTRTPNRSKSTFVPRLEALESRNLLSPLLVTNTSSDPNQAGSLPYEIQQANSAPGASVIDFNISGSGIQTINITSTLFLSKPITIDGTSQPGYNGTPLISIQGNSNVPSLFYLGAGSAGSTLQGLDMYNYTANAVTMVNGTSGNTIQNNWLGFFRDPTTGNVSLNNALGSQYSTTSGIGIQSSNNTIRGNVIDGNYNGIDMGEDPTATWSGTVYSGNSITGNFIGTDPSGTTSVGYGNRDAVFLSSGCQGNFIGPNNVFSGNLIHGVEMFTSSDTGNVIFGNKIGTDVTGRYAIPNGDGITITDGANGNTIGGPFGGNLISGNTDLAISLGLAGYGTGNNNWVVGNIIGLNADQTAAISPGTYGISINNGSNGNHIQGNIVCSANLSGVVLANTQSNAIIGNWIGESSYGTGFGNGSYGVALLAGANYNTVTQNAFGPNATGAIYVDPNAIGNNIGSSGGSSGSGTTSLNQFVQEILAVVQNLLSTYEQLIRYYTSLVQQIVQQVFHTT